MHASVACVCMLVGGVACDASDELTQDSHALLGCPCVHWGGLLHLIFCVVLMSFLCGVGVFLLWSAVFTLVSFLLSFVVFLCSRAIRVAGVLSCVGGSALVSTAANMSTLGHG